MAEIYQRSKRPNAFESRADLDQTRCKAGVVTYHGLARYYAQCSRKAGADGWCKQHHPDAEKKRREDQRKAYEADMRRRSIGWKGHILVKALEQIRDGDNNPRETARIALEKLDA